MNHTIPAPIVGLLFLFAFALVCLVAGGIIHACERPVERTGRPKVDQEKRRKLLAALERRFHANNRN